MLIADGTSTEEIIEMDREDGMRAIPPDRQLPAACDCLRLHRVEHYPRPSFDERLRAEIRRIAGLPAKIGKPVVTATHVVAPTEACQQGCEGHPPNAKRGAPG